MKELLKQITEILNKLSIPFLITGSIAYSVYSIPRATRDIDIILEISEYHVFKFIEAIQNNYYYSESTIRQEVKRKGMFNIIDLASGYKIDLIVLSDDSFEQAKFNHRKSISVFGIEVPLISPEDLILSKLRWIQELESELHKRDIQALLKNPDLDIKYIKSWCVKLQLKTYNLI